MGSYFLIPVISQSLMLFTSELNFLFLGVTAKKQN